MVLWSLRVPMVSMNGASVAALSKLQWSLHDRMVNQCSVMSYAHVQQTKLLWSVHDPMVEQHIHSCVLQSHVSVQ